MTELPVVQLSRKDLQSDQEVRWCPGCGDYAILKAVQSAMATLGRRREDLVIISGIGCAARFPYYMETYGMHSIHGRAPAFATATKMANPDLSVFVVGGDGDMTSIGGNHLVHALRRNVDITILLFNNRIYGLTKGQFSPTSGLGVLTKSTPMGSIDRAFDPVQLALGAGATFVARTVDLWSKHLEDIIVAAHAHKGCSLVEILQNCIIYNDGAFDEAVAKQARDERTVDLVHGEPVLFGKAKDKGLRLNDQLEIEVVSIEANGGLQGIIRWDEAAPNPAAAMAMAAMEFGEFPLPTGIFRRVEGLPYEARMTEQMELAQRPFGGGPPSLESLFRQGDVWTVG